METRKTLDPAQALAALAVADLTDPAQGRHAMQLLLAEITAGVAAWAQAPLLVDRGSAVVTVADNYTALGYPEDAITRDTRYTRYLSDGSLLRSHTTAALPALLRRLAPLDPADVVLAVPGLCWRRDVVDRLHVGTPHQLDVWRLSRRPLGRAQLEQLIEAVVAAAVPGRHWRAQDAVHPYTVDGLEVEVSVDGEWVEVLECGLASPRLLAEQGLAGHGGLALGMGLDRLLMIRKGVGDIRLLRAEDPRVARQMLDLEPYRAVSSLPPVKRDLSLAVAADIDAELLGDRLRALEPPLLELVESLELLAETGYRELPPQAQARMGMDAGQKNVLIRLTLRHPTRTIDDQEANAVRDAAYALLHEGRVWEWSR